MKCLFNVLTIIDSAQKLLRDGLVLNGVSELLKLFLCLDERVKYPHNLAKSFITNKIFRLFQ